MTTVWNIHKFNGHDYVEIQCPDCGCFFMMPAVKAKEAYRIGPNKKCFCPNGHTFQWNEPHPDGSEEENVEEKTGFPKLGKEV